MKKFSLLLILFFTGFFCLNAQNNYLVSVSGHVMNDSSMMPVANQPVNVQIMSAGMVQIFELFTDYAGLYSGTFTGFGYGNLEVSTVDCNGMVHTQSAAFTPNNNIFVFDFYICSGSGYGCAANFYYEIYPGFFMPVVGFFDQSTGNPSAWFWDFGDGTTSTEQNPVHTYNGFGIFWVCLTISNPDGSCQDEVCMEVNTNGTVPGCYNWFWYNQLSSYDFEFFADADPPAQYYFWDFGDGSTAAGQNVSHSYMPNTGDIFLVTLKTYAFDPTSNDSCYAESSQKVFTFGYPGDCSNWFWYASSNTGTVEFFGEAYPPAETYVWDFGDGTTGEGQNVSHEYDLSLGEMFLVTLTTTSYDPAGTACTATSVQEVYIGVVPPPGDCYNSFWYKEIGNNTLYLFGESFPYPANDYIWTFPDGTVQYGQEAYYTYDPNLGNEFLVCLDTYSYMNTPDTCHAQTCQFVYIGGWYGGSIAGTIYTENIPADEAFAMLYMITPDGIQLFDYQFCIPETGYYSFMFVPEGEYYVVGFLSPVSVYFNQFFPTYYQSALNWEQADIISTSDSLSIFDIHLIPVSGSGSGEGSISGNITLGDEGNPGSGMQVILMDADSNPIQFTTSNDDGNYSFSNLEFGLYHVRVEMAGMECETATVELSNENPHTIVNFIVDGTEIILSIHDLGGNDFKIVRVYPNPVIDHLNLELIVPGSSSISMTITDLTGREIQTVRFTVEKGLNSFQIPVNQLSKGFYTVKIMDNQFRTSVKFIK